MAKYSDIKGFTVQTLSSDPAASVADTGSWASVASMNTARNDLAVSMAGTTEAALISGGYGGGIVANVESWNGSSWTETTDIPTATYAHGGTGTSSTAALIFGGQTPGSPATNATYEWDGSSWTSGGNLNSPQRYRRGAGSQTAGLAAAGNGGSPPLTAETEQYNGSSWTEVGDMNSARTAGSMGGGASPYTAAIYFGGYTVPDKGALTESWDGSSWTEVGDLNTARQYVCGSGTSTDGLAFGGGVIPPITTNTEAWDGSSWTEVANMGTSRYGSTGTGASSANALVAGGNTPSASSAVEEWTTTATPTTLAKITEGQLFFNSTTNTFKETITDIPAATWATGGDMNVPSHARGGAGHANTLALAIGADPSPQGQTEEYNGSTWSEKNDLNVGRRYIATLGTTTLALAAGGANPGGYSAKAETWDGTNWTAISDINSTRGYFSGAGVYNSAIIIGGEPTDNDDKVEIWNGSSWTEVSEVNTGVRQFARAGHSSANDALKAGGYTGTAHTADTETWNGSSWTEVSNLNTSRYSLAGDGNSSSSALAFGGYTSTNVGNTESWNGSTWTEVNDLGTARNNLGGAGISSSALAFGANPASAATEEFTASLSNKTITTS